MSKPSYFIIKVNSNLTVDPHFGALSFSPFMQVIWLGGTIPGDHVASLERLTENQVSALRSYQNSTPVGGYAEKSQFVMGGASSAE